MFNATVIRTNNLDGIYEERALQCWKAFEEISAIFAIRGVRRTTGASRAGRMTHKTKPKPIDFYGWLKRETQYYIKIPYVHMKGLTKWNLSGFSKLILLYLDYYSTDSC